MGRAHAKPSDARHDSRFQVSGDCGFNHPAKRKSPDRPGFFMRHGDRGQKPLALRRPPVNTLPCNAGVGTAEARIAALTSAAVAVGRVDL